MAARAPDPAARARVRVVSAADDRAVARPLPDRATVDPADDEREDSEFARESDLELAEATLGSWGEPCFDDD